MKVSIEYSDGRYSLVEAPANSNGVEITDEEWRAYRAHCVEELKWYLRLQDLDNEQWAKDHPDENIELDADGFIVDGMRGSTGA